MLWTVLCLASTLLGMGCATNGVREPSRLGEAKAPAWSLVMRKDDMVVAVSPAGKALRLAGSAGVVVGTAVDAGVNAKYRKRVRDLLEGYDTAAVFEASLESRLKEALGPEAQRVAPLDVPPDVKNEVEAQQTRLRQLARQGSDVLLDLKVTYGLYGPSGTMAMRLSAEEHLVAQGKRVWRKKLVVTSGPVLANAKLGDPTNRAKPDVTSGLTVDEEIVKSWAGDDGTLLKARFQEVVHGAVSALLCELGFAEEAVGEYHLGKWAMMREQYQEAEVHFTKAARLDPKWPDITSARAVNVARSGNVNEAIAMTETLVEAYPNYGPGWFNLAWWYAIKKRAPAAKACYEKALGLGMRPNKKIEKALVS